MKLSAPKQGTWTVALILGILGVLGALGVIPVISQYAFWIVVVALALMLLATFMKGL